MSRNPPSATSNIRAILVPGVTRSWKHSSPWASTLTKYEWHLCRIDINERTLISKFAIVHEEQNGVYHVETRHKTFPFRTLRYKHGQNAISTVLVFCDVLNGKRRSQDSNFGLWFFQFVCTVQIFVLCIVKISYEIVPIWYLLFQIHVSHTSLPSLK